MAVAIEQRPALSLFPAGAGLLVATVDDLDAAIGIERVSGADLAQTTLEAVVQPGDFMPLAAIARQLEAAYRLDARWRQGGAGGQ